MKYYLDVEIDAYYHIDNVYGTIICANNPEEAYNITHEHKFLYEFTESDYKLPLQEGYKTERAWKQACKYYESIKFDKIKEWNESLRKEEREFFKNLKELNIPCLETEAKIIQDLDIA